MTKEQERILQEMRESTVAIGNLIFSAMITDCFVCGSTVPSIKNKLEQIDLENSKVLNYIKTLQSEK